jgi:DNA repair photolyase
VPCTVAIAPVVPQVTDHELEAIVEAAAEAGATGVFYLPVRLPHEVAPLFRAWLDEHFPDRARKVMAELKAKHASALEPARASALVREMLAG